MVATTPKHPWQKQSAERRKQVLATVRACGRQGFTWISVAAMLEVAPRTLEYWKADDQEGKIRTAYAAGANETAKKISARLEAKALDPYEDGNTPALIHMSKHFLRMGDKQTNVNVDAGEAAKSKGSDAERWREALTHLGLEALAPPKVESDDE